MGEIGKPLRVLQVLTGMGSGGVEAFLMNMYRYMDRSKIQFDFLLRSRENIYEKEIKNLGGEIFYSASFPKHYLKNKQQVREILAKNSYSVIHVHANALLYMTALIEAKRMGIPCRIMHSHSTAAKYSWTLPIHKFNQKRIENLATRELACSENAAKWMFGHPCLIVKNAINLERFQYNEYTRAALRHKLGISDDIFVLGHVGRFLPVKNHQFILNVFSEIIKQKKKAVLILVGTGELFQKIQIMAEKMAIIENIHFLGVRTDIDCILNIFDAFIFPSLYEGLGISVIEAQANGLSVFCSENIPKEACISNSVHRINLSLGAKYWAEQILNTENTRTNNLTLLCEAGYNIYEECARLQNIYFSESGILL